MRRTPIIILLVLVTALAAPTAAKAKPHHSQLDSIELFWQADGVVQIRTSAPATGRRHNTELRLLVYRTNTLGRPTILAHSHEWDRFGDTDILDLRLSAGALWLPGTNAVDAWAKATLIKHGKVVDRQKTHISLPDPDAPPPSIIP